MGATPTDPLRLVLKESGSTSRVDSPPALISKILVDDISLPLPEELITEIIVRLPVKSLLRFKCVSKPWLSLISDPFFIRSHFSKSSSNKAEGLNLELLFATKTGMKIRSLYSALHETNPPTDVSAIETPVQNTRPIVGIINGLVCLNLKGNDLCVWNPALNKIKHFSFVPEAPSVGGDVVNYFNFGYDESNDDYKVVCLQVGYGFFDAEVLIYSLKADSWRRIDHLKDFCVPYSGVFANGKIYCSGHLFPTPIWKHFSIDMSSHKFVELQPPKYDAGERVLRMVVSVGRPFVLCDYYNRRKVDLWMLDTHGVVESWCKFVSIPYALIDYTMFGFSYQVLCISSSGEIVFGNADGLLVYNWKEKRYQQIKPFVGITSNREIAAYVESLVWPNYV